MKILLQLDFDGDFCLLTKEKLLLKDFIQSLYIIYNEGSGQKPIKEEFNYENVVNYIIKTLGNSRVGSIINYTTFIKDILNNPNKVIQDLFDLKTKEEAMEYRKKIYSDLIRLTTVSELEIDKAKTGFEPEIKKEWIINTIPDWFCHAKGKEGNVYKSYSIIGRLYRYVQQFKDWYIKDWEESKEWKETVKLTKFFSKYGNFNKDRAINLLDTIQTYEKEYRNKMYLTSTALDETVLRNRFKKLTEEDIQIVLSQDHEDEKSSLLRKAIIEEYKEKIAQVSADRKSVAFACYYATEKNHSKSDSFVWNVAFDGLLLLLEDIKEHQKDNRNVDLVRFSNIRKPLPNIIVGNKKYRFENIKKQIGKIDLPNGTYNMIYNEYLCQNYLEVPRKPMQMSSPMIDENFRVKIAFKGISYMTGKRANDDLRKAKNIEFKDVIVNQIPYTGLFADNKLIGTVMDSKNCVTAEIFDFIQYYSFSFIGKSDLKNNTFTYKSLDGKVEIDRPALFFDFMIKDKEDKIIATSEENNDIYIDPSEEDIPVFVENKEPSYEDFMYINYADKLNV